MIPQLVPRPQLLAANGVFTLTLNAAFALGFALLGPIVVTLAGAPALILIVAALLPHRGRLLLDAAAVAAARRGGRRELPAWSTPTERGVRLDVAQLREGIDFIRSNRRISWSLVYLGHRGVAGRRARRPRPGVRADSLGLAPKDFVVVVLPLGFGIVTGILLLNSFGHLFPRRRIIEGGLVTLGVLLGFLAVAAPLARLLQRAETATGLVSLADFTSLLAIVVAIALLAGIAYGFVAIPSQTQLQEDIPEDVRGRVFGILNMLVSVASFLPILIVGPLADFVGVTVMLLIVSIAITGVGLLSIFTRGPIRRSESAGVRGNHPCPGGARPDGGGDGGRDRGRRAADRRMPVVEAATARSRSTPAERPRAMRRAPPRRTSSSSGGSRRSPARPGPPGPRRSRSRAGG